MVISHKKTDKYGIVTEKLYLRITYAITTSDESIISTAAFTYLEVVTHHKKNGRFALVW